MVFGLATETSTAGTLLVASSFVEKAAVALVVGAFAMETSTTGTSLVAASSVGKTTGASVVVTETACVSG